jgi:prevent-host-death family protein
MTRIGIRELRQRASAYLRRVEAGETIEVTDRGRPIALLTPIPEAPPLDRLRAAGEVDAASGSLDDLPAPLTLAPGQEAPSTILARMRADER